MSTYGHHETQENALHSIPIQNRRLLESSRSRMYIKNIQITSDIHSLGDKAFDWATSSVLI